MSVPGESMLNIGLSFNGFGQLVQVQQAFVKTGQVVNGTVEYFKQCQVEFGKMAARMVATYNTPEKILDGVTKAFNGAGKTVKTFQNFYKGLITDTERIETSIGKISPKLKQLFAPTSEHLKNSVGQILVVLEDVQGRIKTAAKKFAEFKKAILDVKQVAVDVSDSFKKVRETVPAALQVFQDPKKLFVPEQWTMAIFPAIDAIGQLRENSIRFLEAVANVPGIDKFAAKIEELAPKVADFAKKIGQSLIEKVGKFGNSLGSMASKVFPRLIIGLVSVISTVWSFTAALLANPITWIVVGVVALGAAIYLLWKHWDKVVAWFKKGFQWLKDTLNKAPNWVIGLIAVFLPFIGIPLLIIKNWGVISNFFKNIGNAIGTAFKNGFQWIKDTLSKAPNWVIGLIAAFLPFIGIPLLIIKNWGAIVNFFKTIGSAIGSFFSSLWGKVVKDFTSIGNAIGTVVGSLWNKLVKLFTNIFNLVGSIVSKVVLLPIRIITVIGIILISLIMKAFEKIGAMLAALWSKVVVVFNRIVSAVGSAISSAWGQVVKVFNRVVSVIGSVLGSIWGQVVSVFNRMISYIGSLLGSIFNRIANFIGSIFSPVWDQIVNIFNRITSFIGSAIGSIFANIAAFVGPILASIWEQVVSVFTGIGNAIYSLFSSLWNNAVNFITNSINFIGEMIGGVIDFFNGIVETIQSAFDSIWSGIESVFQSIGKMFESIIPDWAKGLFDWAVNGGDSPGKNAPNPAKLDQKVVTSSAGDRQAANQLNQSQNNRNVNNKNTKVDKIEINLTGGKNDHQTAKVVRNELDNYFNQQSAATVGVK